MQKKGVIEHVSIGSAVLSPKSCLTYSVAELHKSHVEIKGFGNNASYIIQCKQVQSPAVQPPIPQ